jgi:hypothetical protein
MLIYYETIEKITTAFQHNKCFPKAFLESISILQNTGIVNAELLKLIVATIQ